MRVCFVSRGDLQAFKAQEAQADADITIFGFDGMGEVSYEKELKRESVYFEEAALLSKRDQNVVVCGCVTNMKGHKRKSALVAKEGKLLGISDMQCALDGEFGCGGGVRIYETKQGKMGVLVADDLNFPRFLGSMVDCGCDFIVCPYGRFMDAMQTTLVRAYAYLFGTPIFLCGRGYCAAADGRGNMTFSSPISPIAADFTLEKEYHLIESRRRGFFRSCE